MGLVPRVHFFYSSVKIFGVFSPDFGRTRSILPTFRPSPERLLIEYLPDPGLFIPHRRPPLVIPDPVVEQILQYLTYQDLLNLEQVHSAIQSEARSNWAWRPHCIDFNVTTLPHYISVSIVGRFVVHCCRSSISHRLLPNF